MLQAVLKKPGEIRLTEVPVPDPGPGEVVIKIMASLSCGTDLKAYLRGHPLIPMPGPFGHEYSGIIIKKGKGVRRFKEGDKVMGVHTAPCRECRYCKQRLYNLCERIMQDKVLGSYAEYLLLKAPIVRENLFKKPEQVSFSEAAFLEPLACVVHPYQVLKRHTFKHALIVGAGPIGLLHLLFLKTRNTDVVVADLNQQRLSLASSLGAIETTLPEKLDETIEKVTDGMGFDLVVECTGNPEVWQKTINWCRKRGVVILFGGCKPGTTVNYPTHRLHYDELTLLGSFHFTPSDVKLSARLITSGQLPLRRLITDTYPLREIHRVFDLLARGRGIKYCILP